MLVSMPMSKLMWVSMPKSMSVDVDDGVSVDTYVLSNSKSISVSMPMSLWKLMSLLVSMSRSPLMFILLTVLLVLF